MNFKRESGGQSNGEKKSGKLGGVWGGKGGTKQNVAASRYTQCKTQRLKTDRKNTHQNCELQQQVVKSKGGGYS